MALTANFCIPRGELLRLFEERKTCAVVFRNFVTSREGVDGAVAGGSCEVVESDLLAALQLLKTGVEEVGFTGFFADNAIGHGWDMRG